MTVKTKETTLSNLFHRFCNSIIFVFMATIFFLAENVKAENSSDEIFNNPKSEYTKNLIRSVL